MDMTGERRIPASREQVWTALNDPAVLRVCIPGCEKLEREADDTMVATAAVKIGPISARFNGRVRLLDLDPPNGYRIEGEGQGGVAGFAKGGATVNLAAESTALTIMTYTVSAQVGGKIAQLGARLIDASAKQMADAFFNRFTAELTPEPAAAQPAIAVSPEDHPPMSNATTPAHPAPIRAPAPPPRISVLDMIPEQPMGFPRVAWIGVPIFVVIFIVIFKSYVF